MVYKIKTIPNSIEEATVVWRNDPSNYNTFHVIYYTKFAPENNQNYIGHFNIWYTFQWKFGIFLNT